MKKHIFTLLLILSTCSASVLFAQTPTNDDRLKQIKKITGYNVDRYLGEGLYSVFVNGKYAIVDGDGKFINNHLFSLIDPFKNGLAYFYKNDDYTAKCDEDYVVRYYGYINKAGKVLGEFKYEFLSKFVDGLAHVRKLAPKDKRDCLNDSLHTHYDPYRAESFMDTTGRIITDSLFYSVYPFVEDMAIVFNRFNTGTYDEERAGYINRKGETVIEPQYYHPNNFEDGFAHVRGSGGNDCLLNKQGDIVVDTIQRIEKCSDSLWLIIGANWSDYTCYFNPQTHKIISKRYSKLSCPLADKLPSIVRLINGSAYTYIIWDDSDKQYDKWMAENDRYGLVDVYGNEILPVNYEHIFPFNKKHRVAWIMQNQKTALVNEKGKIISEWFDVCRNFDDEGIACVDRGEKKAVINTKGEISEWFDHIWAFTEGLAPVMINKKRGYINTLGNIVIQPQFIQAGNFTNGYALVEAYTKHKRRKRFGVINSEGNWVIPPEYKSEEAVNEKIANINKEITEE